jgi:UDP-2,4-diacetamido-2,4,6-trideoxy-beta-L-altropyranose hydrolase
VSAELSLRDAAPSDEAILLEWANDPAVRQASFDSSPIAAETHARWYGAKLASPDTAFFIAEQAGRPVGYSRVDRWGPDTGEIAV